METTFLNTHLKDLPIENTEWPGHLRWRVQLSSCAQSAAAAAALTAANTATQLSTSRTIALQGGNDISLQFSQYSERARGDYSNLTLKNLFNMLSSLEIGKFQSVRKGNY